MFKRFVLVILGFLLLSFSVMAAQTPPPIPGKAGRSFVNDQTFYNILDYGGYADAWHGAAHYAASGTNMIISALSILNVTINVTSSSSLTVSPAWTVTSSNGFPSSNSQYVYTTNAGTGGAPTRCLLTSANNTTGVITFTGCSTTGGYAAPAIQTGLATAMTISSNDDDLNAGQAGYSYGSTTFTTAYDIDGNPSGTTIVLPQILFPHESNTTGALIDGQKLCVTLTGQNDDWCGVIVNDSVNDGRTVTVVGASPSPVAFATTGTQTAAVFFGPILFRPNDATACSGSPRYVEIPQAGSSITKNPVTGQTDTLEDTVANRISALSATLVTGVTTSVPATGVGGVDGILTIACNDFPAYKLAEYYAMHTNYRAPSELYFPSDSFMATGTGGNPNTTTMEHMLQCGLGTVFWPKAGNIFYHGAGACGDRKEILSYPASAASDMVPATTLKHLATLTAGSTATLVTVGNSPIVPGEDNAGYLHSEHSAICSMFERWYPDLNWNCVDLSNGGMTLAEWNPNGWTNGIPTTGYLSGALPNYYTNFEEPLMGYVEAQAPDVFVIGSGDQEGINASLGDIIALVQYTQTAAWRTATSESWNPDVILSPFSWQPTTFASKIDTDFSAAMMRSYVKACKPSASPVNPSTSSITSMHSGGCPSLIDVARMVDISADGYDPETIPMRRARALPMYHGESVTSFPWQYQVPRQGLSAPLSFQWVSASATTMAATFTAVSNEFDFTIGGLSNAAPQSIFRQGTWAIATANSGQPTIEVGYNAYFMNVGDGIAGAAIPTGSIINAISLSGATSTITIGNTSGSTVNLTANVTTGSTLTLTPPGPALAYPGNILRVYNNGGDIAYRYDTVYTPTLNAHCSWTNGNTYFTCTDPEVGSWHQALQVALPGAGSAQCPNPGGSTNCLIGTITSVSFTNSLAETVNFVSGSYSGTTVSNVAPIIYRTSIPETTSTAPVEPLANPLVGNQCTVNSGVDTIPYFQVEYRGSRAQLTYCYDVNPGVFKVLDGFVEREDSPFLFTVDSPNHLDSGAITLTPSSGASFPISATTSSFASAGRWMEVDPDYPSMEARIRIAPDIYGWCAAGSFGDQEMTENGGQCAAHGGYEREQNVLDPILGAMKPR